MKLSQLRSTFLSLFLLTACGGSDPAPATPDNLARPVATAEPVAPAPVDRSCRAMANANDPARVSICKTECDSGTDASCDLYVGFLASADPIDAASVPYLQKGCDRGNDDACYAVGKSLAASTHDEDLEGSLRIFDRLCRAGRTVACDAQADVKSAIAAKAPPPPAEYEGVLLAKNGSAVRVRLTNAAEMQVGETAELERYFKSKSGDGSALGGLAGIFGGNVQIDGWLDIAGTKISKVDKDVVTMTIDHEKTDEKMNGKKVNQFPSGAKIKIVMGAHSP
jgi:hypothetical protein